jgi:type I restriction enzyme M protein
VWKSIETQLWKTADKLRKNIDAAEYKHIALGLVLLKYISGAFVELCDNRKASNSMLSSLMADTIDATAP